MVRLALLVRVLLSLSLILNGSGYAVAATHMQMAIPASTPQPARDHATTAEPPCPQHHRDAAPASTSVSVAPVDAVSRTAPVKSNPPLDCCESGACLCPCVHQAQATIPAMAFHAPMIEHVGVVHPLMPGHATPALPHLIRPPIG